MSINQMFAAAVVAVFTFLAWRAVEGSGNQPDRPVVQDAEKRYTLKPSVRMAGNRYLVIVQKSNKGETKTSLQARVHETQTQQEYLEHVHATDAGWPTDFTRSYKLSISRADGLQSQDGLAGRSVRITKRGDKYALTVNGVHLGDTTQEFGHHCFPTTQDMPTRPVKVGESWAMPQSSIQALGGEPGMVGDPSKWTATGKLTKAYTVSNGRTWGVMEHTFESPANPHFKFRMTKTFTGPIDGSSYEGTRTSRTTLMTVTRDERDGSRTSLVDMVESVAIKPAQ